MTTLSALWESVNDFIALQGSSGTSLINVFDSLKLPLNLHTPIVSRLFNAGQCKFYIVKQASSGGSLKTPFSFGDYKKDQTLSFDAIFCVADACMSWKAYGFESFHDIPDGQTPLLLSFLEILGMAREKGCSNTEASLLLGIPKLHTVVERLVSLGYVVKRVVFPLYGKNATCRCKSRTVLLHLKRFAAQYDPNVDELEIEADEGMRADINTYFTKLLDYHNVQQIAATDAAQAIGIGSKKLIKLKDSFASYVKSGLPGVCFLEREVNLIYPGRQPFLRMRSCLGFFQGISTAKSQNEHEVAMNSPVYEQSVARLRWSNGEGMSSTSLRMKLCLYGKRAARVATELNTVHGYPMKKQQVGKTQANQLYDKVQKKDKVAKPMPVAMTTMPLEAAHKGRREDGKIAVAVAIGDKPEAAEAAAGEVMATQTAETTANGTEDRDNERNRLSNPQSGQPSSSSSSSSSVTVLTLEGHEDIDVSGSTILSTHNTDLRTCRIGVIFSTLQMVRSTSPLFFSFQFQDEVHFSSVLFFSFSSFFDIEMEVAICSSS